MSLEIGVLGFMHVYDKETEDDAISKANSQGSTGHPHGVEVVEQGRFDDGEKYFTMRVFSHVTVKEYEDEEDAKEQALEETGFNRSEIEVDEYDLTYLDQ